MKTRENGWIYFIQEDGTDYIKIGFANDVFKRRKQLQSGNPRKLWLRAAIPGDSLIEAMLHRICRKDKVRSEWFRDSENVRSLLEAAKRVENGEREPLLERYRGDDILEDWMDRVRINKVARPTKWKHPQPPWAVLDEFLKRYPDDGSIAAIAKAGSR